MKVTTATAYREPPETTAFSNGSGRLALFYFRNNPWKTLESDAKVFRHCIVCGKSRFDNERWATIRKSRFVEPLVCSMSACGRKVEFMDKFVSKHRYVSDGAKEGVEDIPPFELKLGDDRVYSSKALIPPYSQAVIEGLEAVPLFLRLAKLDRLYFRYARANGIKVGESMTDTEDPHLLALAHYRKKCMALIEPPISRL